MNLATKLLFLDKTQFKMKKITTTILLLSITILTHAQFGVIGGVAGAAMSSQKRAHVQKHLFTNLNMTFPISLGKNLSGSKLVLPPTYLSADYGIRDNITIGAMLGTMTTKSTGSMSSLARDIISGSIDINDLDLLNKAQQIINGGGSSTNNTSTYEVKNSSTMLGVTFKYNFTGGKKSIFYMANRTGLKIRNVRKDYGETGNELVDKVVDVAETTSGFFSSFSFGGYFFLDAKKKFAINPELGWGPGWGDGFSITGNPLLVTIGATYHRKPKKPVPPKLRQ